jgi:CheY-like chemotaxis protein
MPGGFLPNLKKDFGAAVRAHRLRLGYSQGRLAERAGLHRTYVTDVERGARNISLESMARLARALEMSISSLFVKPEPSASSSRATPAHARILLVEDDPNQVAVTLRAFRHARLINPIEVVSNGAAALDCLFGEGAFARQRKHHGPVVVLLDIGLPKMNGLEVLRRLRSDIRTRGVRIVMLTQPLQEGDVRAALRLGADAFLPKPLDFQAFSSVTPQLNFSWTLLRGPKGPPHRRNRRTVRQP